MIRRGIHKLTGGLSRFGGWLKKYRRGVGRAAAAVLAGLLCALPAVYLNSIMGYLPLFFYVLMLVLSGVYLLILERSVCCASVELGCSCRRSQTQEYCLTLENKSPVVCPVAVARFTMVNVHTGAGTDTEMPLSLAPFEKREFRFSITFAHLGQYKVGIGSLQISSLLGILRRQLPGGGEQTVQVLPRRYHPSELALSQIVETENSRARTSVPVDGTDYTGVREYVFGDPIKNIHWKLSAHTSGYLTKQTEIFGNAGVDIILDFAAPPWKGEDGAFMYDALIECACAAVIYAADEGMESDLWFLDRSGTERKVLCGSAEEFDHLMDELPGITADAASYPLDSLLSQAVNGMYSKNNALVCSARLDENITRRLEQIQLARRQPVMIYIVPPGLDDRERDKRLAAVRELESRNIPCYVLSDVHNLGKGGNTL